MYVGTSWVPICYFFHLQVTVQSLFTGVFYLFTAVVSWTTYAEIRDTSIAKKNAYAMANALQ